MTRHVEPFSGITDRPYSQLRLVSVQWYTIAPELMHFSQLWLTQSHLNIEGVLGKQFSNDPYPRVVEWHGAYYVEDGHHRLVMQAVVNPAYPAAWVRRLSLSEAVKR